MLKGAGAMILNGFKHSPIGPIPQDWDVKLGAQVSTKITKGSSPRWQGFEYQDSGVLFVTSENVRNGAIDLTEKKYLPISFGKKAKGSRLERGDILINIVGASIGRSCVYYPEPDGCEANINQAVCLLRPQKNINTKFLSYFLQSPVAIKLLLGNQTDSARPNLSLADIRDFPFPCPKRPEQDAIVRVIESWDSAIDLTECLIATKQGRRTWIMQQLLTGKRRLSGYDGVWCEVEIGNLFREVNRPVEWDDDDLYALISVRRRSGGLFHRDSLYGRQILTKNLKTVHTGDFLISKMQVLHGATGLVTPEFDGMKVSGSYISMVPRKPVRISTEFFSYFSQLPSFYHLTYLASFGVHIEKMTFDVKWFMKSKVSIPPSVEEQDAIVKHLKATDHELDLLNAQLDALREQKKGLMQKLLTGKVRVKV